MIFSWKTREVRYLPHHAALSDETVSPERDDDGVSWTRASEVASNYGTTRDDRFPSENDVLWTGDNRTSRYFVARVLAKTRCNRTYQGML